MNKSPNIGTSVRDTPMHLGIRGRLLAGFAGVVAVFLVSVFVSLYFISIVKSDAGEFLSVDMPTSHSVIDLQASMIDMRVELQALLFLGDAGAKQKVNRSIEESDSLLKRIDSQISGIKQREIKVKWSNLKTDYTSYIVTLKDIVTLVDKGQVDSAIEKYKLDLLPATKALNADFYVKNATNIQSSGILDDLSKLLTLDMIDISSQIDFIYIFTIIFLLLSIVVSYISAYITSVSIINPIRYAMVIADLVASGERDIDIVIDKHDETGLLLDSLRLMKTAIKASEDTIKQTAEENKKLYNAVVKSAALFSEHSGRVASGDLTKRLDLGNGGIDQELMLRLGGDLNKMTDNLSSVTEDIMLACSSMVSTLDEVRHAVDAQSSGASEQASSINQITASIAEIEKSASQTMHKARDLGSVAEKTRQSGQMGLESIETSVMGMKSVKDKVQMIAQTILDLSRQTQQVGEITSVVNNLAQQSKMLALNASIEAAKAGDAGKGFAVVAAEVKNLAEQSEQSTSQVQKILEDIKIATEKAVMVTEEGTKGVDNGLQMIERTGEVIRDLNEVIREATIASQQIEAAVRQESAGIEQITAGMNEINSVTASFVDSVAQTTEAMDGLSNVATRLKSSVDIYKI